MALILSTLTNLLTSVLSSSGSSEITIRPMSVEELKDAAAYSWTHGGEELPTSRSLESLINKSYDVVPATEGDSDMSRLSRGIIMSKSKLPFPMKVKYGGVIAEQGDARRAELIFGTNEIQGRTDCDIYSYVEHQISQDEGIRQAVLTALEQSVKGNLTESVSEALIRFYEDVDSDWAESAGYGRCVTIRIGDTNYAEWWKFIPGRSDIDDGSIAV